METECNNPECPQAGRCGGACAAAFQHNFKPGDRLRSLRSGRIWVVVDAKDDPPFADWNDRIAVRDPKWNVTNYIWMTPNVFEKAYDI